MRFKLSSATEWTRLPDTEDTFVEIRDLPLDRHDFEVRTVNSLGVRSVPVITANVLILGLQATPSALTNFGGQIVGTSALLSWDRHPALDVRRGGFIEIRHQTSSAGGNGANALLLARVSGDLTVAQVAAKRGTYYGRAVDQVGQFSDTVEWSTDNVAPVQFAQVISSGAFDPNDSSEAVITIQEDPTFPSTDPGNTMLEDTGAQVLKLQTAGTFDTAADVDAIVDFDAFGADENSIEPEGVYFFSSSIVLSALTRMRIETQIDSLTVNTASTFDERPGLVDGFESWDGAVEPGAVDAFIEARFTRDDPLGSPTWSPWERIDTRNLFHRGVEFRLQARSFDPAYNIHVSQLRVLVREVDPAG